MQINLHRHFDIVLKKYHSLEQAKDRKIFIYFPSLHNVFPFKKKSNFIYFDDKNLFGKMLLKHENRIDKVQSVCITKLM